MNDDKWVELKETINNQFDVETENEETVQTDDVGQQIINKVERLTFETPQGKFKLERTTRPAILDKKVHYSHTSDSKSLVEYVLSPNETNHKLCAYKFDNDSQKWTELSLNEGFRF